MFKIGDIVEITDGSDSTGMLDFKKGKGYEVIGSEFGKAVQVANESGRTGWYYCAHFKLKEEAKVEKKECLFKEGQTVWDVTYGVGVVSNVFNGNSHTPPQVQVKFEEFSNTVWYNPNGTYQIGVGVINRTLFFSPPVVTGATEPVFEPVLKKGDMIVLSDALAKDVVEVVKETDFELFYEGDGVVTSVFKNTVDVYRLGEKIKFN